MEYLQEGCPNYTQRGNLCAIPLKKVKYKVKNQETTNSYKTCQRFISKYGSIHPYHQQHISISWDSSFKGLEDKVPNLNTEFLNEI